MIKTKNAKGPIRGAHSPKKSMFVNDRNNFFAAKLLFFDMTD